MVDSKFLRLTIVHYLYYKFVDESVKLSQFG